jgi:hypothetical protein
MALDMGRGGVRRDYKCLCLCLAGDSCRSSGSQALPDARNLKSRVVATNYSPGTFF